MREKNEQRSGIYVLRKVFGQRPTEIVINRFDGYALRKRPFRRFIRPDYKDIPALAVGPNLVEVRAWDIAGNPSPVTAVTLIHDPSPPTLILTGPRDGSATSRPTVLVTGTTEPGATLSANGILVAVAPDGSFSFPLALLEGENILTVTARDPAGNEISRVIRVAYAPPTPPEFDWVMPAFLTAFLASLLALGTLIGFRNGGRRGGPREEGRPSQETPSSPPPPPPSLP